MRLYLVGKYYNLGYQAKTKGVDMVEDDALQNKYDADFQYYLCGLEPYCAAGGFRDSIVLRVDS